MRTRLPAFSAAQSTRFRATQPIWEQLTKLLFHRHPRREWGTYFRFGYRRTPWGLAISLVDLLQPQPGDLSRASPIVSFSPEYIAKALAAREASPLGVGFVHSHPLGWGVVPSVSDDDMDEYFAKVSLPYGSGQPYVSLIVNRDDRGRLQFSGRAFDRGTWIPVTHIHLVGSTLDRHANALRPAKLEGASDLVQRILARWTTLLGSEVVDRCRGTTVGFLGCSGTGSPAVETFARAQIGGFVLVDEQRIAVSNIERMHGSEAHDFMCETTPYKVEIMARMIRNINPSAEITPLVGNGLDENVIDELLRCDLVMGGTDTLHGRALLGDLASLYLVPSIDMGVLPRGAFGRVTSQLIEIARYSAGDPCPYCQGRIPPVGLHEELMPPSERTRCEAAAAEAIKRGEDGTAYWQGGPPQLPTVGYLTTTAGAIAAGYGLNWLLGTAEMPHQRMQFDLGASEFGFVSDDSTPVPGCSCRLSQGYADQGERTVTMPAHFPKARRL